MKYVAEAHVQITGGTMTEVIEAPNERKATEIAERWAGENALVLDGVKPQPLGRSTRELHAILQAEDRRRRRLLDAFAELSEADQVALTTYAVGLAARAAINEGARA